MERQHSFSLWLAHCYSLVFPTRGVVTRCSLTWLHFEQQTLSRGLSTVIAPRPRGFIQTLRGLVSSIEDFFDPNVSEGRFKNKFRRQTYSPKNLVLIVSVKIDVFIGFQNTQLYFKIVSLKYKFSLQECP